MMPLTSSVFALVAIVLVAHCREHGPALVSTVLKATRGFSSGPKKSEELLDAAISDIRIKQYITMASVCIHLTALIIIGLVFKMLAQPSSSCLCQIAVSCLGWSQHHIFVAQKIVVTQTKVRVMLLFFYVQTIFFLYTSPTDVESAIMASALVMTIRFAFGVLNGDIRIAVPGEALFVMFEVWSGWQRDPTPSTAITCFLYQFIISATILGVAGIVEFSTRSRMAMLLNSQSMVDSFRKMLRGLCDGELLLDNSLRVVGKGECLRRLLMTSKDFSSQKFEELVEEDERPRFLRFMSDNPVSEHGLGNAADADALVSAPPCLRISLTRAGHRVGVDLFHVKMPQLLGEETYHLIAVREDSDFGNAVPEASYEAAAGSTPALQHIEERGTTAGGFVSNWARSDGSVPQVSSNSLIQLCPELQEMTLLVDASTPLLDVEQAHLSFTRRGDEFDCSMPSMRRIVRPTDWGTVRSQLREFALTAGSMQSAAQQRDVLNMKLRFQDDAKRCVEARDVQVSGFSSPAPPGDDGPMLKKLCLQIRNLKTVRKPKRRSWLQGLHEGGSEESEGESEVSQSQGSP